MLRRKQIVLAIAVVLLASAMAVATPQKSLEPIPTKDRPIIEIDLHKFADANWNPNNGDKPGNTLRSAIYFADGTTLVWSWLTRDNAFPRVKDFSLQPVSLSPQATHIHAVLLGALTGEARAKHDWSAPSSEVYFAAVQDGNFLACIDKKIRLYSFEFELLREVELASPAECRRLAALGSSGISPSGRSILASPISGEKNISEILGTRTLKPVSTANEAKPVTITAISDN